MDLNEIQELKIMFNTASNELALIRREIATLEPPVVRLPPPFIAPEPALKPSLKVNPPATKLSTYSPAE